MPDLVGIAADPQFYVVEINEASIVSTSSNTITCTVSVPLGSAILFSGGYTLSATESGTSVDPASTPLGTFTVLSNGPTFNSQSVVTGWTVELYNPSGWFSAATDPTIYAATLEVATVQGALWSFGSN